MKDALCRAFCDALTVRDIPAGLAIGTSFKRGGDALGFFVIYNRKDNSYARLEDDGLTIPILDSLGIDLSYGFRASVFAALQLEFGVVFDVLESTLHTQFVPVEQVPSLSLRFLEFLLRMQDFSLLARERVEDTFRSDVFQSVMERFNGRAEVALRVPPSKDLINHVADVVVLPPDRAPLALYVGDTDTKALEAVVLQQKTVIESLFCSVMLVVRTAKPKRVRERTLAIVKADKELSVAVFPDNKEKALQEMERLAFGSYAATFSAGAETRH